jgi:hypothetical protein
MDIWVYDAFYWQNLGIYATITLATYIERIIQIMLI